jgi:hypothetical protein
LENRKKKKRKKEKKEKKKKGGQQSKADSHMNDFLKFVLRLSQGLDQLVVCNRLPSMNLKLIQECLVGIFQVLLLIAESFILLVLPIKLLLQSRELSNTIKMTVSR